MQRALYNLLWHLVMPFIPLRLWWRGRKEAGYRQHVGERFGRYAEAPHKPVIWIHAVSVGETRAAQPLVRALAARYWDHEILITHMTAAGRATAEELYGDKVLHAFLPYDYPWAVAGFLDHFKPRLGIIIETEIWFNLVRAAHARRTPLLLANGRLSERAMRRYEVVRPLIREALAHMTIAAQSEADAARFGSLGATALHVTGNIKFDITADEETAARGRELRELFGARPVLLAASTREGEEALLLDALAAHPLDALVVIVPRHPQRFDQVAALLARRRLTHLRRSAGRRVPADCRFVLGDTMGEMMAYYSACDVAFIGGSLLPFGAQNLIEACAVGAPVLIGPSTFNFEGAARSAVTAGAALKVGDAQTLVTTAAMLLADEGRRKRMAVAGLAFCAAHRGATLRTMAVATRLASTRQPERG